MRRSSAFSAPGLALLLLAWPLGSTAQVAPASPDVAVPAVISEIRADDPEAFTFGRAWRGVAERARAQRHVASSRSKAGAAGAVSGNYEVPVFPVRYSNTSAEPWPVLDLQQQLFGGGASVATLSAYYDEISGGRVAVDGTVQPWHSLPQPDTWYEGMSNGLDPMDARIGELIQHTLDGWDAIVDFGLYDNDGPDGLPNSGDDDGYVDFVAFVHPEVGAECGGDNGNLWSHRWRYTAWPASGGLPYVTQDASANGGFVLVDDYVVQPALACGGSQMIQIGVFCHEFGHAFGLPDLYDTNGGGASGLGHWCLMSSGNWNSPSSPAHMSAWAKRELGWVEVETVSWQGATIDVEPVQTSGRVYELGFTDDRWRRSEDCAIAGFASLAVGLDDASSQARGWMAARGYGNGWHETIAHDFHHDGSGPVTLEYDYVTDTEGGFDFCFVLVEVGGEETTLAVYDGQSSGSASHDLDAVLGPGSKDYRIKFRFRSDAAYSNEDGNFFASCAPFVVDAVRVTGGSADHDADFEQHVEGWYQPDDTRDNPPSECWLVENRQRLGSDSELHGEGLMIYHVDQEVMHSALRNSGGSNDQVVRGVVVEEGDGQDHLVDTVTGNRGDDGDPWPGSTGVTAFGMSSLPASFDNDGDSTAIAIESIEEIGDVVRAVFRGGDPPPRLSGVNPSTVDPDSGVVTLSLVDAGRIRHGALLRLVRTGHAAITPSRLLWLDHHKVEADFDLSAAAAGAWDMVVENPDGQTAVADSALTVLAGPTDVTPPSLPRGWQLAQNHPNPFNPSTTLRFSVPRSAAVELSVFDARGRRVRTLRQGTLPAGHHEARWDGTDDAGLAVASGLYFARLRADGFERTRKMLLAK